MYCVVSWRQEGRDLGFWDGGTWGLSRDAMFFETRQGAEQEFRKVKVSVEAGFLPPNVLDVAAYNERFGASVGPRAKVPPPTLTVKIDPKTGIPIRE